MSIQVLNAPLYAKKSIIGSEGDCNCENCRFYADNIVKNKEVVAFMQARGLDVLKADEVICYSEADGFKHYSVDINYMYSEDEGIFTFPNATIHIGKHQFAEKNDPPYWGSIQVKFEI